MVTVKVNGCRKFHYFNLPFCDRVKNISEIGGEVAEIQTGLQIQIDKDNSVSDLHFISIVCFWPDYSLIEILVVTKLARGAHSEREPPTCSPV